MIERVQPIGYAAEEILGELGFHILWQIYSHVAEFIVIQVTAVEMDNNKAHYDTNSPGGSTDDITQAEIYLKGSVKWDGCSDIHFGYHHWCGPEYWAKHMLLMEHLYKTSFIRMEREAADDGNEWQLEIRDVTNTEYKPTKPLDIPEEQIKKMFKGS
jgi:hypothetical protein